LTLNYQLGWLSAFLKIYISVLQQASDLDDTVEDKLLVGDRPKPSIDPDVKLPWKERLSKRSQEELHEVKLTMADWAISDPLLS
jgi:N-terminal acetyltransferase B complex non-catalytic subunit